MSKSKTIVFCCNTSFAIANFRSGAIKALVAQGHKVIVIAPHDSHTSNLSSIGAKCHHWCIDGHGISIFQEAITVKELITILREIKPDICFFYTIKCVIYGAVACRRLGIEFIPVITGLGYAFINETWISWLVKLFYRRTLRWAKEIWFLNQDDREIFIKKSLINTIDKTHILPGEGIDLQHFNAPSLNEKLAITHPQENDRKTTFLMICRVLRDKGVIEYIESARKIKATNPQICFQLLGECESSNPSAISRSMVSKWESEGIIQYFQNTRDVRPYITQADCIVLPSYREGTPRVLLEASAMRRPIIATDVPGCRDVVLNGVTGFLCKPRNVVDLTENISKICKLSHANLVEMGEQGRRHISNKYDEAHVIQKYLSIVKDKNY